MYTIIPGSGVAEFLDTLGRKVQEGQANANEQKLYKKLKKTLTLLANNPRHPGLASHKIQELKDLVLEKYGKNVDIWESYVENHTPGAKRIYWYYGPGADEITLVALELHPEHGLPYQQIAQKAKQTKFPKG